MSAGSLAELPRGEAARRAPPANAVRRGERAFEGGGWTPGRSPGVRSRGRRLKNKIGQCKGPFNLHVNVVFHPPQVEDAILCEVQFYPRSVFDLQHRQHLAYELQRARAVGDLL